MELGETEKDDRGQREEKIADCGFGNQKIGQILTSVTLYRSPFNAYRSPREAF
jgi:hypothetical protein